jgi:hypothetical protein
MKNLSMAVALLILLCVQRTTCMDVVALQRLSEEFRENNFDIRTFSCIKAHLSAVPKKKGNPCSCYINAFCSYVSLLGALKGHRGEEFNDRCFLDIGAISEVIGKTDLVFKSIRGKKWFVAARVASCITCETGNLSSKYKESVAMDIDAIKSVCEELHSKIENMIGYDDPLHPVFNSVNAFFDYIKM